MDSISSKRPQHPEARSPDASAQGERRIARVSSAALLGNNAELIIEHGGREYRLRRTQSGKLILTA